MTYKMLMGLKKMHKPYSQTIDPTTGRTNNYRTISVTALVETTMMANAWATAILVPSPEKGLELSEEQKLVLFFIPQEVTEGKKPISSCKRARSKMRCESTDLQEPLRAPFFGIHSVAHHHGRNMLECNADRQNRQRQLQPSERGPGHRQLCGLPDGYRSRQLSA